MTRFAPRSGRTWRGHKWLDRLLGCVAWRKASSSPPPPPSQVTNASGSEVDLPPSLPIPHPLPVPASSCRIYKSHHDRGSSDTSPPPSSSSSSTTLPAENNNKDSVVLLSVCHKSSATSSCVASGKPPARCPSVVDTFGELEMALFAEGLLEFKDSRASMPVLNISYGFSDDELLALSKKHKQPIYCGCGKGQPCQKAGDKPCTCKSKSSSGSRGSVEGDRDCCQLWRDPCSLEPLIDGLPASVWLECVEPTLSILISLNSLRRRRSNLSIKRGLPESTGTTRSRHGDFELGPIAIFHHPGRIQQMMLLRVELLNAAANAAAGNNPNNNVNQSAEPGNRRGSNRHRRFRHTPLDGINLSSISNVSSFLNDAPSTIRASSIDGNNNNNNNSISSTHITHIINDMEAKDGNNSSYIIRNGVAIHRANSNNSNNTHISNSNTSNSTPISNSKRESSYTCKRSIGVIGHSVNSYRKMSYYDNSVSSHMKGIWSNCGPVKDSRPDCHREPGASDDEAWCREGGLSQRDLDVSQPFSTHTQQHVPREGCGAPTSSLQPVSVMTSDAWRPSQEPEAGLEPSMNTMDLNNSEKLKAVPYEFLDKEDMSVTCETLQYVKMEDVQRDITQEPCTQDQHRFNSAFLDYPFLNVSRVLDWNCSAGPTPDVCDSFQDLPEDERAFLPESESSTSSLGGKNQECSIGSNQLPATPEKSQKGYRKLLSSYKGWCKGKISAALTMVAPGIFRQGYKRQASCCPEDGDQNHCARPSDTAVAEAGAAGKCINDGLASNPCSDAGCGVNADVTTHVDAAGGTAFSRDAGTDVNGEEATPVVGEAFGVEVGVTSADAGGAGASGVPDGAEGSGDCAEREHSSRRSTTSATVVAAAAAAAAHSSALGDLVQASASVMLEISLPPTALPSSSTTTTLPLSPSTTRPQPPAMTLSLPSTTTLFLPPRHCQPPPPSPLSSTSTPLPSPPDHRHVCTSDTLKAERDNDDNDDGGDGRHDNDDGDDDDDGDDVAEMAIRIPLIRDRCDRVLKRRKRCVPALPVSTTSASATTSTTTTNSHPTREHPLQSSAAAATTHSTTSTLELQPQHWVFLTPTSSTAATTTANSTTTTSTTATTLNAATTSTHAAATPPPAVDVLALGDSSLWALFPTRHNSHLPGTHAICATTADDVLGTLNARSQDAVETRSQRWSARRHFFNYSRMLTRRARAALFRWRASKEREKAREEFGFRRRMS